MRQGKRLQIVVALLRDPAGVEVARATALRFRTATGPDDAGTDPVLPPIETPPFGAVRAAEPPPRGPQRVRRGARDPRRRRPGPGHELVPGHPAGDRGRGAVPDGAPGWASDFTANSGNFLDLSRWSAINADLTISLARVPVGEWTGVTARAWYVEDGIGLARADMFDLDGYVGTCTAALLVDEVAVPYPS